MKELLSKTSKETELEITKTKSIMDNLLTQESQQDSYHQPCEQTAAFYFSLMIKCVRRGDSGYEDWINKSGKVTIGKTRYTFYPFYPRLFNEILADTTLDLKTKSFYLRTLDQFFNKYFLEPNKFLWSSMTKKQRKKIDHYMDVENISTEDSGTFLDAPRIKN